MSKTKGKSRKKDAPTMASYFREYWEANPNGNHNDAIAYVRTKPAFSQMTRAQLYDTSTNIRSELRRKAQAANAADNGFDPSVHPETAFMRRWHQATQNGSHDDCVAAARVAGYGGSVARSYQAKSWASQNKGKAPPAPQAPKAATQATTPAPQIDPPAAEPTTVTIDSGLAEVEAALKRARQFLQTRPLLAPAELLTAQDTLAAVAHVMGEALTRAGT